MNRFFKYSIIFLLAFSACKKSDTSLFSESSDVRVQKVLTAFQNELSGADNGWVVTLYPEAGGGYTFWMKFNDSNRVSMVSDFDDQTATEVKTSSYRVKAMQQPTLIFDTYTYIHLLADPNGSINGGTNGVGLESDFEFFLNADGIDALTTNTANITTLNLQGRFNGIEAKFEKATSAEAQAYQSGELDTMMHKAKDFAGNSDLYMNIGDDSVSVSIQSTARTINFSWDNGAKTFSTPYATTITGIVLKDTLNVGGAGISSFDWDEDNQDFYATVNSNKIPINILIIPMTEKFGYGNIYESLFADGTDGQSALYTSSFESVNNSFSGSISDITLSYMTADTILLNISYYTSKAYSTNYLYKVEVNAAGDISFGPVLTWGASGTGGTVSRGGSYNNAYSHRNDFKAVTDFFSDKTFIPKWPNGKPGDPPIGGLYLKDDNSVFVTGTLSD